PEPRRSVSCSAGSGACRWLSTTRRGWSRATPCGTSGRRRVVVRRLTKCAPHAFEGAGVGVEDNHTTIAIAVGNEHFVRFRIYVDIGSPLEILGVFIPAGLILPADLEEELPVACELQHHIVDRAIRGTTTRAAAGEPQIAFVVGENAVFGARPVVPLTVAPPGLHEFTAGVVLKDRWRRLRSMGI